MAKVLINRIKVVLAEKRKTNRWLAEQLDVNEATVSRWVNNHQQPPIKTFQRIAKALSVTVKDLFESN